MEEFKRQNIFNLLGNDSRKYHSCYITTYSFDFLFFEERVLPTLKRAGINNVNLFVDAKIFQQKIIDSAEVDKVSKRGYSVTPINMSGAFHPKLLLAVGKNKGLLAVGSGNLTSSGINSNEEIWAAFHLNQEENDLSTPFFAKAKQYLKDLSQNSYGFNKNKSKWLESSAPWFENLSSTNKPLIEQKGISHELITSNGDFSFYKTLIERLPKNPIEIKILSPFYNKTGALIQNLIDDLEPNKIHCVIDPLYGTIPYNFTPPDNVDFTDWNEIEEGSRTRRLHAKVFQFEYEKESFLLFGSANASTEAFGNKQSNGSNAEAIILSNSKKKFDWLENLGISLPKIGTYDVKSYTPSENISDTIEDKKYLNCLKHAEVEGPLLTLIFKEGLSNMELDIVLLDTDENPLFRTNEPLKKSPASKEIPESSLQNVFKLALFNGDDRYSNFVFVHRVDVIRRTNPDTQQARINALINSETFSDLELDELLEYINFGKSTRANNSSARKILSAEIESSDQIPDAISQEEFNKNEALISANKSANDELEVLEEFLFELTQTENQSKSNEFSESAESIALESSIEGGINDVNFIVEDKDIKVSYSNGKRLKGKLKKVVSQVTDRIKGHKENHLKNWRLKQEYTRSAGMEELKSILVGVHLILIKKNDCFIENRSVFRLRIKQRYSKRILKIAHKPVKVDTMNLLDRLVKKFRLKGFSGFSNLSMEEVAFTINEYYLEELKAELSDIPELKLIYMDDSPSQIVDHHYFNTSKWSDNAKTKGIQQFILEGLGSLLRLMNNGEVSFNDIDLFKWKRYKKRLLYQSIIILESFNWNRKSKETRDLLELNLFHSLVKDQVSTSEFTSDLNHAISKSLNKGYQKEIEKERILELYIKYTKWIATYYENPKILKQKLNNRCVNQIIFNKSLGFAIVKHVYNDFRLNLESPLGSYNSKRNIYGFVDVIYGPTSCFMN